MLLILHIIAAMLIYISLALAVGTLGWVTLFLFILSSIGTSHFHLSILDVGDDEKNEGEQDNGS